ncbi:P7-2 [Southern rice black-streaked dwarf virus]|uniref:p7-2 n=2 Tax=Southern rice black-streaked dwarf virus TaxID=519497 RepID=E4WKX2_9REOV|nr:P7-2 [Southern rice black-streaked dwarf virus]ACI90189.1 p7-2 [Rice black-streaked dwarf virus 2]AEK64790.1 P7-2 [Southern rice black-streaked dwarf virus]AEV91053.1 nonstructural protein P7-2 [Rice black-streaked dwarf virus 2]AFZ65529.1 P7-2 protein [Southern rice black-streaked dwarf virus]AGK45013.1 P7.2 protein [Southern rice black-streaked dwarf virus]
MNYNDANDSYQLNHVTSLEFDPLDPEVNLISQDFDDYDYHDLEVNSLSEDLSDMNLMATRIKNFPDDTFEVFESLDAPPPLASLIYSEVSDEWCDIDNFLDIRVVNDESQFEFVNSHINSRLLITLNSNPNILWTAVGLLTKISLLQEFENFEILNYWQAMERRWDLMNDDLKIGFVFRAFDLKQNQFELLTKLLGDSLFFAGINLIGKSSMLPMLTVHSISDYIDHWFPTECYSSDNFMSFIKCHTITVPKWKKIVVQFYLRQIFSRSRTQVLMAHVDIDHWYDVFMKTLVFKSMRKTKKMLKNILNL